MLISSLYGMWHTVLGYIIQSVGSGSRLIYFNSPSTRRRLFLWLEIREFRSCLHFCALDSVGFLLLFFLPFFYCTCISFKSICLTHGTLRYMYLPKPSSPAGCDKRWIFMWSLTGLNLVFLFLDWLLYQGKRAQSMLLFYL